MIVEIKKDAATRMGKTIESLKHELGKIRTGRANPQLLDHIQVPYYGSQVPLNQVASVSVGDSRTLVVQPWEKKIVPDVEKAILNSDLGLNPVSAGDVIRVPLPPLTEARRKEMTRVVRHEAENARVAIRNIRRDAIHHLKALLHEKKITKDDDRRAEEEVQKITDKLIADVDSVLSQKEAELMEL
jgi:ribosome recycling factor